MRFFTSAFASLLTLGLAGLSAFVNAKSSTGDSVLVVLDPSLSKDDYSIFFSRLEQRGYKLTFRAPKDVSPAIIEYDVPQFSHIILFTPETKSYAQDITPQSLVGALEQGTNILITLSEKQTPLSSLATEFSLILPPPGTPVISHHPFPRDAGVDLFTAHAPSMDDAPMFSPAIPDVWYRGVSHALGNSPYLVPLLRAPEESFAADSTSDAGADTLVEATERGGEGLWAGSAMGLVTGFQTNAGSRAVFAGSIDLFSNELAKKHLPLGGSGGHIGGTPGNNRFAQDVAGWLFQETLTLRIDNVTHHRAGEDFTPEFYTINDEIVYEIQISKYDLQTSTFLPYSDIPDLQLEFTMLDPHVRTALPAVSGKPGTYQVSFRVPDRHGVFKFVVNWRRAGWSYLQSSVTVPVVPPRHDGYPRFLSAAWPYYAGAASTSLGFLVFSTLWLAGDVRGERKRGGKKTE